jgi:hypothetical protein
MTMTGRTELLLLLIVAASLLASSHANSICEGFYRYNTLSFCQYECFVVVVVFFKQSNRLELSTHILLYNCFFFPKYALLKL